MKQKRQDQRDQHKKRMMQQTQRLQSPQRDGAGDEEDERLVEEILEELRDENAVVDQIEDKIQRGKRRVLKRIGICVGIVLAVAIVTVTVLSLLSFSHVTEVASYEMEDAGSSTYEEFAGGILKYNRNGIAFMDAKGNESWNESGQFQTPIFAVEGDSAAVADQGGNSIMVVDKNGMKGQITTTQPIQKVVVSSQGIVAAILKDETTPSVVCYDATGNVLVEHKASMSSSGYPVDLALSEDGYMLLVSYLYVADGSVTGRAIYYNFAAAGQNETDHIVAQADYAGEIIGKTFFMDKDTSVVVGEEQIQIYEGANEPKVKKTIKVSGEIESVFHSDKCFGILVKEAGKTEKHLIVYSASGRKRMDKQVNGDYKDITVSHNQVILYSNSNCLIYSMMGIKKFEGDLGQDALKVVPVFGLNKYAVIGNDGIQIIRLK